MSQHGALDLEPVLSPLLRHALANEQYDDVFTQLCEGLVALGVPLWRAHLTMHTLHPLVASVDLTWRREQGLEIYAREFTPAPSDVWLKSPLYWMLSNELRTLRQDPRDPDATARFPFFDDIRQQGATDYIAFMTPFGDPATAFERRDGIIASWTSDDPAGFTASQIDALERLQLYIGVVAKLSKNHHTARNVLAAYLGDDAGRRVLDGQIRLGDVERIPAVIWFSDLRDSTAMAERLPVESFLEAVNAYFDCTAGAVLAEHGEVLRFIGDAVLAVFPVNDRDAVALCARRALAAARDAQRRMRALNRERAERSQPPLAFGLGLHVGELLYGNIGVPTRIEFSVIGRTANEVARLESLTKTLSETVLVSDAFRRAVDIDWRDLGAHAMKGVADPMQVYAPPDDS